jgi:heat-inducible transcriptional repressor
MFLDDRKRRILRAIIDDYIDTAEPIGSRTIARKHEIGLSSATIRNEMADLEEMGYLAQPHTSAGRIPSDKGYRLYVDQLMKARKLTDEEAESIKIALEVKINELSQLIRQASLIMSRITRYTSIAMTPQMKKSTLKAVQVVPVDQGNALVVVVTKAGIVRNSLIRINENITADFLIRVSNIINEKLSGLSIEQINLHVIQDIENEIRFNKDIVLHVLSGIKDCIDQVDNQEIYMQGATNIFNFPEFRDIVKAREFLNMLDTKDILQSLLTMYNANGDIKVRIGNENEFAEIKDCSLITATYRFNDEVIGSIGVIGPTRMEYPKVITSLDYIRERINFELNKLIGYSTEDD